MTGACLHPEVVASCRGKPRMLGLQLGDELRERIMLARSALSQLAGFRCLQPWWLPYPAYLYWAEFQAWRLMEQPVRQVYPAVAEQIEGMAEGAGLNLSSMYLFQALESVMTALDICCDSPDTCEMASPRFAACSAVAVRGRRSASGRPIVAHNFDNVDVVRSFYVLRERHGAGQYRTLEFTMAPLSGAVDGVNEKGLCITYNYGFTASAGAPAPSVSMAISEALGTCGTVREAITSISSRPRCGGALLMLADAEGDVAALELASDRACTRRPDGADDCLFHGNAYQTAKLQEVEAPAETRYGESAPLPLRGRRVMESPERRDARLAELMATSAPADADDLARLMSDHGADGRGDDGTICMHGDYWSTNASLQLFPAQRKMRVAYGPACQAEFREFAL
ncbi:MAG: hypothetical protein KY475_01900 [Planctomycetes bacterium]|nr:hypothetical protein [Planctomycetota bacterium]